MSYTHERLRRACFFRRSEACHAFDTAPILLEGPRRRPLAGQEWGPPCARVGGDGQPGPALARKLKAFPGRLAAGGRERAVAPGGPVMESAMTGEPIELDERRGTAAQKATCSRRCWPR
jgi:hypothetical protein